MSSEEVGEILQDVVILGRAAPEELSDHRRTTCTGAWSENRGFIRIYPIKSVNSDLFNRWDVVNIKAKRNPQDTRAESWKLAHRDYESCVEIVGEYPREQRATLLTNLEDDCVQDINEAGRSLGIIKPDGTPSLYFEDWDDEDDDSIQSRLINDPEQWLPDTRDEFDYEIRIRFTCSDCNTSQGYHDKTLLEWGAYLAVENNNLSEGEELEPFYNLDDEDYNHWIFVGNQAHERTSFIAINLLWVKNDVGIYDSPFDHTNYRKVSEDFESDRNS